MIHFATAEAEDRRRREGFTLIELSIVLVIIALIAGGILVGRDLIEAAKVRAQVSQLEAFEAAVNTFKLKYNALPGDILYTQAAAFGMAPRSGQPGHGDGDGFLEDNQGITGDTESYYSGEAILFWNDLAFARLIPGDFSSDTDTVHDAGYSIAMQRGHSSGYLPDAKIGSGNSIAVFDEEGYENQLYYGPAICGNQTFCYAIIGFPFTQVSIGALSPGLTPVQAYAIDNKLDDGIPNTGRVLGAAPYPGSAPDLSNFMAIINPIFSSATFAAYNGQCTVSNDGGHTFIYNIASSYADRTVCILNVAHK